MILYKKLNRVEVLEALALLAAETIPSDKDGDIEARYNDEDDVEIFFIEKINKADIN